MNYLETIGKKAKKAFEDLKDVKHKKILIDVKNRKTTNVIPIPHLSRGSFFKEAEERILNAIEDNCCYL